MRTLVVVGLLAVTACQGAPTYLRTGGYVAAREASLGRVLLLIASIVVLIVILLVLGGIYRRRHHEESYPVRESGGLPWIFVGGIAVPTAVLLGVLVVSLRTLAAVSSPPASPGLTVQVIGHRWWWEVRYPGSSPAELATTANEIHIPLGVPVRLELSSADVIHSFWVPQLAGKTDLIPGQRNLAWIQADTAGRYWGRCGEYCGLQHANMALSVIAEPRAEFTRWMELQRRPAADPIDPAALAGRDVFLRSACSLCHAIRGTGAGGILGPDLTHVASRRTIAAGTLRNTKGNLFGWVVDPQAVKPGAGMPAVPLEPDELKSLVRYLESLN